MLAAGEIPFPRERDGLGCNLRLPFQVNRTKLLLGEPSLGAHCGVLRPSCCQPCRAHTACPWGPKPSSSFPLISPRSKTVLSDRFLCGNHSICPSNREFCTSCNLVGNQYFSWFYQLSGIYRFLVKEKRSQDSIVSQNFFVPSFLSSIEDTFPASETF
jgi:hypothetical protein